MSARGCTCRTFACIYFTTTLACVSSMTGCARTTPTGARPVTPLPQQGYTHAVLAREGDKSFEGLLISLQFYKDHQHAPIQYDLTILQQALENEIVARGGEVLPKPSADALVLRVKVSRYLSERLPQMPRGSRIRTYLDYTCRMDHAEGRSLPADRVRSIAGIASGIPEAHQDMLQQFVTGILLEPRTAAFLAEHRLNAEGLTRIRLGRLARDLIARTNLPAQDSVEHPLRIALAPLQSDPDNRIGAQVLPPLMDGFRAPQYRFFTRTQLASILEEQSLQMTDLVDQRTTVTAGRLQGVDYLVTGSVMTGLEGSTVQLELLSVASGEVISAASVLVP